jgi:hypothetical protein
VEEAARRESVAAREAAVMAALLRNSRRFIDELRKMN